MGRTRKRCAVSHTMLRKVLELDGNLLEARFGLIASLLIE